MRILISYVTRNSSGDEIANVNFLYDDIAHALENTIDSCINSATDRFLQRRFAQFSEITQCNGHYADEGHSRSPMWLILTCLLSCTVSKLWLIIGQIFAGKNGVSHFDALAGVDSLPISPWYIAKNYILWPTFLLQKVLMYLQPLLRKPPRKLPNSVKLHGG